MPINIDGDTAADSSVQLFNGNANLLTSVRVLKLAAKLGIEVKEAPSGAGCNWIAFELNGERLSNISFYDPAHAYAFLLGFAAKQAT